MKTETLHFNYQTASAITGKHTIHVNRDIIYSTMCGGGKKQGYERYLIRQVFHVNIYATDSVFDEENTVQNKPKRYEGEFSANKGETWHSNNNIRKLRAHQYRISLHHKNK